MLMQLCLLEPGCGSFTLFIFSVSGSGQDERADVHQGGEGWGSDVGRRGSLVIGFVLFHLLTLTLGVCAPHTEGSTFNTLPKKRHRPWVRTLWWPDITDFMDRNGWILMNHENERNLIESDIYVWSRLFSGPASKPETLMDKTKKFLAALVKFGASISPACATNVRKLVFRLAVNIPFIERIWYGCRCHQWI